MSFSVGALKGDANSCGTNVRRAEQKRCCFGEHYEAVQAKGQRLVFPNRSCFLLFPICGALVRIFPVPSLPPRACFFKNCCRAVKEQKAKSEPKQKRKPKKVKVEPPQDEEDNDEEIDEDEEQPPPPLPKKRKRANK